MLRKTRFDLNDLSPGRLGVPKMLYRSKSYQPAGRPTLDEVLTNTAPPPYTLNAFMTYLSQTHCLETLQFILAAKQYRETYNSFVDRADRSIVTANSSAGKHICKLYNLLMTIYVLPGAPREVNLSVDVRDTLLQQRDVLTPPLPEALDPGVKYIHDLMEDSVFGPFLNSHSTSSRRGSASEASNRNDVSSYRSIIDSESQPTGSIILEAKRPSLNSLGRTLSWPPWSRSGR